MLFWIFCGFLLGYHLGKRVRYKVNANIVALIFAACLVLLMVPTMFSQIKLVHNITFAAAGVIWGLAFGAYKAKP